MSDSAASVRDPRTIEIDRVLASVGAELSFALGKFPVFNSPHEGKAVIEEELDELWKHVKENTGRSEQAREEAIQIAAMACRYVIDLIGAP
jgi:hypothetical protein